MKKDRFLPEQKLRDSVFFKLFAVSFCILIPVNLLLFAYAAFVLSSASEQIYVENENSMKVFCSQLDVTLNEANTRLYRLVSDQKMLVLRQADSQNADNEIEWYGARNYIMNTYSQWLQDYPLMEGFYSCICYENGEREFVISSASTRTELTINDRIREYVNDILDAAEPGTHNGIHWEALTIGEENCLFLLRQSGNCFFGGWFDTEKVLDYWGIEDKGYCFLDRDGRMISYLADGYTKPIATVAGGQYLESGKHVIIIDSERGSFSIAQVLPEQSIMEHMSGIVIILILLTVLSVLIIPLLVHVTKKYIIYPVNQLLTGIKSVEQGKLDYQIQDANKMKGEFALLNQSFNTMVSEIHNLKIEAYERELEKQRIKMQYLSKQIQPHFILNTLNILYCYQEDEYELSQKMILCIAKYFRYVVKVDDDFVELRSEMEHIVNYFQIEQARYQDNFTFQVTMDDSLKKCAIPPLLIQNFAENSIKYSLSMKYKVNVSISAKRLNEKRMLIQISDTGKGISTEVLNAIRIFQQTHKEQECLGVGIQNAIERLDIMYHGEADISFDNNEAGGAEIHITLPCITIEGSGEEDI